MDRMQIPYLGVVKLLNTSLVWTIESLYKI